MFNFFISYSRDSNIEWVEQYISSLETYGFKIWYDKVDVILGKDIRIALDKTLVACQHWDGMILFLDSTYFSKDWCLKELEYALENKINIYPILLNISKQNVPIKYKRLKDLNLCTVKSKNDITYAICKTLYLYINTVDNTPRKLLDVSEHPILKRLIFDFQNQNQQISDIIFTCDNISLCIKYLLLNRYEALDNDIKILHNIIHQITKNCYIEGHIERFQLRIVVKATTLLISLCC